jgi:hypothetical protein
MSRSASLIVTLIIVLTWTTSTLALSMGYPSSTQYQTGGSYLYQAPEYVELAEPCSDVFCQPLTASIENGNLAQYYFVAALSSGSDEVGTLFAYCPDEEENFDSAVLNQTGDQSDTIYYDFCFWQAQITCSNNGKLVSIPISFDGFITYTESTVPPTLPPNVYTLLVGGLDPFGGGVATISSIGYDFDALSVEFSLTDSYGNPYCANEPVTTSPLTGYFGNLAVSNLQNQPFYSSVPGATQATQFANPYNNYGSYNSYQQQPYSSYQQPYSSYQQPYNSYQRPY